MSDRPDFADIRRHCDGMMKAEVYERIYDTACAAPRDIFIEVGTAHAAATVCLALALRDSGRSGGRVYSFDTFRSGSRTAYKGKDNLGVARGNLERFGVSDLVTLVQGDIRKTFKEVPQDRLTGLMMLDADGMIDRDFRVFYDALEVGSPVIIDDCADRARVRVTGDKARVDQKHRLTFMLTRNAEHFGLIEPVGMVNETYFGRKLDKRSADWSVKKSLSIYRNLVFADANVVA